MIRRVTGVVRWSLRGLYRLYLAPSEKKKTTTTPLIRYALVVNAIAVAGCLFLWQHWPRPADPPAERGTCTYKTCPRVMDDAFNVHLIPYSHIDVGWLDNADEYYTGISNKLQDIPTCVRCILKSTISELQADRTRTFNFVEMKYFSLYWEEAGPEERATIRKLLYERRLEFLGGSWVMGDAAVTFYNDLIDQQTMGFQFINDTFGPCALPRCAWHVDQFGHAREYASLLAQIGFDALFVSRVPLREKEERQAARTMEFLWQGSPKNLKNQSAIFTHVTYNGYTSPTSYFLNSDQYRVYRAASRKQFISDILLRYKSYNSNHLMVIVGSDFAYRNATNWFKAIDELITSINTMEAVEGYKLNLLYSTPSCYAYHARREQPQLQTKSDDFLPHFSKFGADSAVFWSGYYTSRPGLKRHIKYAGQVLQSCKQLMLFAKLFDMKKQVDILRNTMSIMQHHDAITGTQKKSVTSDYNRMLSEGIHACQSVMSRAYYKLWWMSDDQDFSNVTSQFCPDLNISSCPVSEYNDRFYLSVYNPLGWEVTTAVRFPTGKCAVSIYQDYNDTIPYQRCAVPDHIKKIPERHTRADTEILFMVSIPSMAYKTFLIHQSECHPKAQRRFSSQKVKRKTKNLKQIENEYFVLYFNRSTGLLYAIRNKESNLTVALTQRFSYYGSQYSGAYSFTVKWPQSVDFNPNSLVDLKVFKGKLVEEAHQTFNDCVSQIVRLYKGEKFAEFQWIMGPINISEAKGVQVISRFTSSLDSGQLFYTDSNGRETMERRRNTRTMVGGLKQDSVSNNYYPVASRIYIKDSKRNVQLTIIPDRGQGGSSLRSGELELMVHRRTFTDDEFGLDEPLDEVGEDEEGIIYTGKHYLCLDTIDRSAEIIRRLSIIKHLEPTVMFTPVVAGSKLDRAMDLRMGKAHAAHKNVLYFENGPHIDPYFNFTWGTFLSRSLPDNVHLLTMEYMSGTAECQVLLRLEHVFEVDDHPILSDIVILSLEELFETLLPTRVRETSLGVYVNWKRAGGRARWYTDSNIMRETRTALLRPMEIKTYILNVRFGSWKLQSSSYDTGE